MLLYPQITSENQMFSDVFRGYKNGVLGLNGLNKKFCVFHIPTPVILSLTKKITVNLAFTMNNT